MSESSMRMRAASVGASVASAGAPPARGVASSAAASRRERLREFQTGLSDKLRRAQNAPLAVNRLGIQIASQRLLIDLADAGEILAVPDITPVPLTKVWYRGLANVRGNLIGIVDLSLFAGGPTTPIDKESRVLAFSTELRFSVGILVSRMLGLRSAADLDVVAPGDASPAAATLPTSSPFAPWVRSHLIDANRVAWQELDLMALTSDDRFVDIARA